VGRVVFLIGWLALPYFVALLFSNTNFQMATAVFALLGASLWWTLLIAWLVVAGMQIEKLRTR